MEEDVGRKAADDKEVSEEDCGGKGDSDRAAFEEQGEAVGVKADEKEIVAVVEVDKVVVEVDKAVGSTAIQVHSINSWFSSLLILGFCTEAKLKPG